MIRLVILALFATILASGCGQPSPVHIRGVGSSQAAPMMKALDDLYTPALISYFDIGSGIGTELFLAQDYDFLCSEIPLSDGQREDARAKEMELVGFPVAFSAIVPVYRLDGLPDSLVFSGPVLADIHLGKITQWNDKAIQALNPKVQLPALPIYPVVRSDPSGSINAITLYLNSVSEDWQKSHGITSLPKWKTSGETSRKEALDRIIEVPGNKGVIKAMQRQAGSLSLMPLTTAHTAKFQIGKIRLGDKDIEANPATIEATVKESTSTTPPDLLKISMKPTQNDGWPIVTTNWLIFQSNSKSSRLPALLAFLRYTIHEGQDKLKGMDYVSLPQKLIAPIDQILEKIKP